MSNDLTETTDEPIALSEMIATLRRELAVAAAAAPDGPGRRFSVDRCEIELQVAVTRSTTGKGGVKFWVVEAGAEHARAVASTHTFRLHLMPNGGPLEVGDDEERE